MIYDFKRFSGIINRLEITPNQCYICMMLMTKGKERTDIVSDYIEKHGKVSADDLEYLIDKGYLEDFNSPKVDKTLIESGNKRVIRNGSIVELFYVTPKFKEGIWIDDEDAAKEAWDAYPKVLLITNNKTNKSEMYQAKNIEYEEFENKYGKIINGNGILHKKIVEMFTQYKRLVKEKKVIGMGLKKAIETKYWETIEAMVEMEQEESQEEFGKNK